MKGPDRSYWGPYLRMLQSQSPPSLCCTPSSPLSELELKYLCQLGPQCSFVGRVRRSQQALIESFGLLDGALFSKHRATFPTEAFKLERYAWACRIIVSRSFTVTVTESSGGLGIFTSGGLMDGWSDEERDRLHTSARRDGGFRTSVLVPGADFINHDANSPYHHQGGSRRSNNNKQRRLGPYGYSPRRGGFRVRADRDYAPGEHLHVSYGDHDNRGLAMAYGFVQADNEHDGTVSVAGRNPPIVGVGDGRGVGVGGGGGSGGGMVPGGSSSWRRFLQEAHAIEADLRTTRATSLWKDDVALLRQQGQLLTPREDLVLRLAIEEKRRQHVALLKALKSVRDEYMAAADGTASQQQGRQRGGGGAGQEDGGGRWAEWRSRIAQWDRQWERWMARVADDLGRDLAG